MEKANRIRKPQWLKSKLPSGESYKYMNTLIKKNKLHTICSSAKCPNAGECWEAGTATLMILGDMCTRACKFCNVKTGKPAITDWEEPKKVAKAIKLMKLKHAVITSVDRDDLNDGGSQIWAETIREIKKINPNTTLETLIPDFLGKTSYINKIIAEKPEVISHNLETVKRLTPQVRSAAKYDRSLEVIKLIADSNVTSKSGIMVGLGETEKEVFETIDDLRNMGCEILTIGQYLQPTEKHLEVQEYITPKQFEKYRKTAIEKGFNFVQSSPLTRSSYHAEQHILQNKIT